MGWLNLHCGLIPSYKGVDAIFWALLNEENELGVTIHKMDEKFDTGPIVMQNTIKNDELTYFQACDRCFAAAEEMYCSLIEKTNGVVEYVSPREVKSSYFSRPKISDGRIYRKSGKRFI